MLQEGQQGLQQPGFFSRLSRRDTDVTSGAGFSGPATSVIDIPLPSMSRSGPAHKLGPSLLALSLLEALALLALKACLKPAVDIEDHAASECAAC